MTKEELELIKFKIKRHSKTGKVLGSLVWVHIDYAHEWLGNHKTDLIKYYNSKTEFDFNIVRLNYLNGDLMLFYCPGFDYEDEPQIHASLCCSTGKVTLYKKNRVIYHHKWLFVPNDYDRFSVKASIERSLKWKLLSPRTRKFNLAIGRFDFWDSWVKDNLIK